MVLSLLEAVVGLRVATCPAADQCRKGTSHWTSWLRLSINAKQQVKDVAAELGVTHAAVSLARNEAMKLLHEGWLLHFDRDAGVLPLPDRNPRTKRSAYLAKLAEFTAHPAAATQRVTA